MAQKKVVLYTRSQCPLCDKAKETILELLKEQEFQFVEIDIRESDELTEKYGLMIPVVEIDEEEVGFGQIDKFYVKALLNS